MKFSEIDFDTVKDYLVAAIEEDIFEISMYIDAAKSYVKEYTALSDEELDEKEYLVMPTLMLISHFYENKTVETDRKINVVFKNILNLGKVHSLWLTREYSKQEYRFTEET